MTDTDLITADERAEQASPKTVTTDSPEPSGATGASLSTMVLPELRELAGRVGVKGTSGMRKSDLIAAIREHQSGGASRPAAEPGGGR